MAVKTELAVAGAQVAAPNIQHSLGAHRVGEVERWCGENRIGQKGEGAGIGRGGVSDAPVVAAVGGRVFSIDFAGLGKGVN